MPRHLLRSSSNKPSHHVCNLAPNWVFQYQKQVKEENVFGSQMVWSTAAGKYSSSSPSWSDCFQSGSKAEGALFPSHTVQDLSSGRGTSHNGWVRIPQLS